MTDTENVTATEPRRLTHICEAPVYCPDPHGFGGLLYDYTNDELDEAISLTARRLSDVFDYLNREALTIDGELFTSLTYTAYDEPDDLTMTQYEISIETDTDDEELDDAQTAALWKLLGGNYRLPEGWRCITERDRCHGISLVVTADRDMHMLPWVVLDRHAKAQAAVFPLPWDDPDRYAKAHRDATARRVA